MARHTHITHVEDRILTDGTKGAKEAIEVLKGVADFLSGNPGGGGQYSSDFVFLAVGRVRERS